MISFFWYFCAMKYDWCTEMWPWNVASAREILGGWRVANMENAGCVSGVCYATIDVDGDAAGRADGSRFKK